MSQPNNVWNRGGKQINSTSRTPQNRSSTASPIQPNPSQAPKQESSNSRSQTPASNAWQAPRNSLASGSSNGPSTSEPGHVSANGFNSAEVKQFLCRESVPVAYKPQTSGGNAPWGGAVQPHLMSTGQAFFPNINKQISAFENGG